jgi:hypothetical protein
MAGLALRADRVYPRWNTDLLRESIEVVKTSGLGLRG